MRPADTILLVVSLAGCGAGLAGSQVALPGTASSRQAVNRQSPVPRFDSVPTVMAWKGSATREPTHAKMSRSGLAELHRWVNEVAQVRIRVGRWIVVTRPSLDSLGMLRGTVRQVLGPKRLWGVVELPVEEYSETPIELHLTEIDILQLPAGTRAAEGALIGATAGAGLGLLVGAEMSKMFSDEVDWGAAGGAAAFFGVVGTGVGALMGGESRKWTTVYVRT